MKRILSITAVFLLFVFTFVQAQEKAPVKRSSKPNIIFILADDMGYSDMSWQGSAIQTPNLDKLKTEGMSLERNYVQPQCSPSRVSFYRKLSLPYISKPPISLGIAGF
mgnify:FL=1|tara:strand:+ start:258 stop:581 length:324 start_codon:yes stop_codon:yes gene_type:complete